MPTASSHRRATSVGSVLGIGCLLVGLIAFAPVGSARGEIGPDRSKGGAAAARVAGIDGLYLRHEPDDVSAVSPTNAWEVGLKNTSRASGYARHWDGTTWSHVRTPVIDGGAELEGVKAFAPNDVWAVGTGGEGFGTAITERWNGLRWQKVACVSPGGFSTLNAVDGLAPDDVWAVGVRSDMVGPLIEHWDGTTWSRERVRMPLRSVLLDVDAASPTDVWAAGYVGFRSGEPGKDHARVVHDDGTGWTTSLAFDGNLNTFLSGVAALAPDDVWTVGSRWDPGVDDRPETLHWDGVTWTRIGAPTVGGLDNDLHAVSALAPDDLIAAGTYQVQRGSDDYQRSLSERGDGTAWTVMP